MDKSIVKNESMIAFISNELIVPYENIKFVEMDRENDGYGTFQITISFDKKHEVTLSNESIIVEFIKGYKEFLRMSESMIIENAGNDDE